MAEANEDYSYAKKLVFFVYQKCDKVDDSFKYPMAFDVMNST